MFLSRFLYFELTIIIIRSYVGANQSRQDNTFYRPEIIKINTVQKVSLDFLEPNK